MLCLKLPWRGAPGRWSQCAQPWWWRTSWKLQWSCDWTVLLPLTVSAVPSWDPHSYGIPCILWGVQLSLQEDSPLPVMLHTRTDLPGQDRGRVKEKTVSKRLERPVGFLVVGQRNRESWDSLRTESYFCMEEGCLFSSRLESFGVAMQRFSVR